MADFIDVPMGPGDRIEDAIRRVEQFAVLALEKAVVPIRDTVRDLTPRGAGAGAGRLVRGVLTRPEAGGREQVVYGQGVVMMVHEKNAIWTKLPPHKAILSWVTTKLGKSGKQAESAAWGIRHKIRRRGLTLPNREDRGKMFGRGYQRVRDSGAHFVLFKASMRKLARAS
jgi:hypothetical protein